MSTDLSTEALEGLRTDRFAGPVTFFEQTDSTNERALELLMAGAPEGALVVADHQMSGRGRRGRTWESPVGSGLLFSLVLRPASSEVLELLTTAAGIAVAESVREITGIAAGLKWPNDVVVDGRKLAGILVESRLSAGGIEGSVVGVGLNVSWPLSEAEAHELTATSLVLLHSKKDVVVPDRVALLEAILFSFEKNYGFLEDEKGRAELVARAASLSSLIGHEVSVRFPDGSLIEGKAAGLTTTGALEIELEGRVETVRVGEIEQLRKR